MVSALALLLICQLAGEGLARGLGLPVPGPVLGLLLLFIGLVVHARLRPAAPDIADMPLGRTAAALLASLGLLFVPAGVGVVQKLDLISRQAGIIVTALVVSTVVTLIVTVGVFRLVSRLTGAEGKGPADG